MPSHFPHMEQSLGLIEWHWRQIQFVYVRLTVAHQSCLLDSDLHVQSQLQPKTFAPEHELIPDTAQLLRCNTLVPQKLSLVGEIFLRPKAVGSSISTTMPCPAS